MNTNVNIIIDYFNKKTQSKYRKTNIANVRSVESCLTADGSNIDEVKAHIDRWVEANQDNINLVYCMEAMTDKPDKSDETAAQVLKTAMDAMTAIFTKTEAEKIEDHILEICEERLSEYIRETYGSLPKKFEVSINSGDPVTIQGVVHSKFKKVLGFVAANEAVFLVGPAGCGKNFLCAQVAEALGLPFYFSNALTQEYFLTGFTDANGVYQESQFYKAFTGGGLFMLDEMDASIPEVLIKLNAALANKYFDFPAPIGKVMAHPDFRVIAAGNTYGLGADIQYVGRNQLDMASLDRFGVEAMDYDETIELDRAMGDKDLVTFAHEVRSQCTRNGIMFVFSYRAINRLAKMRQVFQNDPECTLAELLDSCVFKGMDKDSLRHIYEGLTTDSEYKEALKDLIG